MRVGLRAVHAGIYGLDFLLPDHETTPIKIAFTNLFLIALAGAYLGPILFLVVWIRAKEPDWRKRIALIAYCPGESGPMVPTPAGRAVKAFGEVSASHPCGLTNSSADRPMSRAIFLSRIGEISRPW